MYEPPLLTLQQKPPRLITNRNDFIHNCCYMCPSQKTPQLSFPSNLSLDRSQQYQLFQTLVNSKFLLPYQEKMWFYNPIKNKHSKEDMRHRYIESLGLWKRYRKYHDRGYRFYPYPIEGFYHPDNFNQPHFHKSQTLPLCSQCNQPCNHYSFQLDCGHCYHIGCLSKKIQTDKDTPPTCTCGEVISFTNFGKLKLSSERIMLANSTGIPACEYD